MWHVLRGRRLCGLKFRRQFPIEPFIVDFACIERRLVIEIDGGYHDYVDEKDQSRQQRIETAGWQVIRFTNEEVLEDVEAVATAIARRLDIEGTPSPQPSPPKH
jgi:very-short-patch-repair endonuclease